MSEFPLHLWMVYLYVVAGHLINAALFVTTSQDTELTSTTSPEENNITVTTKESPDLSNESTLFSIGLNSTEPIESQSENSTSGTVTAESSIPSVTMATAPIQYVSDVYQNFLYFNDALTPTLPAAADGRVAVYLMGFASVNIASDGWSSGGCVPAIEMALVDVNARTDILTDYELRVRMEDTKCDAGWAIKSFYDQLENPPAKVMILGGGCSVSTTPIARAAPYFGLAQMSYSAASPELSNRDLYPNFFRTASSDFAMIPPIIYLLQHYSWDHVATLNEINQLFTMTMNQVHEDLRENNITIITSNSFTVDVLEPILDLQRKKAKIIISDTYEGKQRLVFCEVFKLGLYGPLYQWIIPGWYDEEWMDVDDTDCSVDDVKTAAEYALTVTDLKQDFSGEESISGQLYSEYYDRYMSWPTLPIYGYNQYHPFGYDAVWAAALALNETLPLFATRTVSDPVTGELRPGRLDDFAYGLDEEFTELLKEKLENTEFFGVSGAVGFESGDRVASAEVGQMRGGRKHLVAVHHPPLDLLEYLPGEEILWHGSGPPVAMTETVIVDAKMDLYAVGAIFFFTIGGAVLAVAFFIFNLKNNQHPFIKMSSPRLNNVILVGCILSYSYALSLALDMNLVEYEHFGIVCMFREWALPLGFSSLFGAMFVKTWRVHRIFTKKAIYSKPNVRDWHLFGFLGLLLGLDISILVTWTIVDTVTAGFVNVSSPIETELYIIVNRALLCDSVHWFYWIAAIYGIKVLLLLFGCFLAYETRSVRVPGLNDSKYIGLSVYNVVVMSILGVTVSLVFVEDLTIPLIFRAFCIITAASATLFLIFIPKVKYVLKHPLSQVTQNGHTKGSATFQYTLKAVVKTTSRNTLASNDSGVTCEERMGHSTEAMNYIGTDRNEEVHRLRKRFDELEEKLKVPTRHKATQTEGSVIQTTEIADRCQNAQENDIVLQTVTRCQESLENGIELEFYNESTYL